MHVKHLEVHQCVRFSEKLGHFIFSPTKDIQLILGTNGAGKSSLTEYIYPFAPKPNEFGEGGYREIVYLHEGKQITLRNEGSKHSFIVDGRELNKGGTNRVQAELIEEYFRLDKVAVSLLTGKLSLTRMSQRERMDIITHISNVDFGYALGFYNELTKEQRALKGVVKKLGDELKEFGIVPSKDAVESIRKEVRTLRKERDVLQQGMQTSTPVNTTEEEINSLKTQLEEIRNVYKARDVIPIEAIQQERGVLLQTLETLAKEKEAHADKDRSNTLQKKIREARQAITELQQKLLPIANITSRFSSSELASINIDNELSVIMENKDVDITLVDTLSDSYNQNTLRLDSLRRDAHTIEHTLGSKTVDCPECKTTFIPEVDERPEQLKKKLVTIKSDIASLEVITNDLHKRISRIVPVKSALERVKREIGMYVDMSIGQMHKEVDTLTSKLSKLISDANQHEMKLMYQEQIVKQQGILHTLESEATMNELSDPKHSLEDIERREHQTRQQLMACDRKVNYHKHTVTMEQRCSSMETQYEKLSSMLPIIEHNKRIEIVNRDNRRYLEEVNQRLEKQQTLLTEASEGLVLFTDLSNKNDRYMKQLEVINQLVKRASPHNGLIAEAVHGVVGKVINDVNEFIKEIWEGGMEIKIGEKSVYDFKVHRPYRTPQEIAKSSSGMTEAIDLAFRISAIKMLGLTDYPFIIDEFGASMDTANRKKAVHLINKMPSYGFRYTYVISHMVESTYITGNDTEITILDDTNIVSSLKHDNDKTLRIIS